MFLQALLLAFLLAVSLTVSLAFPPRMKDSSSTRHGPKVVLAPQSPADPVIQIFLAHRWPQVQVDHWPPVEVDRGAQVQVDRMPEAQVDRGSQVGERLRRRHRAQAGA